MSGYRVMVAAEAEDGRIVIYPSFLCDYALGSFLFSVFLYNYVYYIALSKLAG
jgi:hypothetical protein